jgi:hypothetical protein
VKRLLAKLRQKTNRSNRSPKNTLLLFDKDASVFLFRRKTSVYGENKMDENPVERLKRIDVHCHVGLLGDIYPHWGRMSDWFRQQAVYKVFLLYGRIREEEVSDNTLRTATEKTLAESALDQVVCLALDPVYDGSGHR